MGENKDTYIRTDKESLSEGLVMLCGRLNSKTCLALALPIICICCHDVSVTERGVCEMKESAQNSLSLVQESIYQKKHFSLLICECQVCCHCYMEYDSGK